MDQQIHPVLSQAIQRYVREGYRVINQTDTTAQLVRPKKFSCLWACILSIFYIFYYWSKKEDSLYLRVADGGRLDVTKGH